ncbi:MAG TPA: hypothetical protein VLL52_13895, partial [Anaerolineae bacterium]|nr:hypothetical protein [Anaerolineae bacterium]
MGGFPLWTLLGMGLSILVALILTGLALITQSPSSIRRFGLTGFRLELPVRALNGYTFACLLLTIGFFIAGVPLGPTPTPTPDPNTIANTVTDITPSPTPPNNTTETDSPAPTITILATLPTNNTNPTPSTTPNTTTNNTDPV